MIVKSITYIENKNNKEKKLKTNLIDSFKLIKKQIKKNYLLFQKSKKNQFNKNQRDL